MIKLDKPAFINLLQQKSLQIFKDDKRSKVWLVEYENQKFVIKQFRNHPFRQCLTWFIQYHPAQREARMASHLAKNEFHVAPVYITTLHKNTAYLVTPYIGKQIFDRFFWGDLTKPESRHNMILKVATLINYILSKGYIFRDCKLSNMVLDDDSDILHLIDVMSFSKTHSFSRIYNMLDVFNRTAIHAKWTSDERRACFEALNVSASIKNKLLDD
ncbi:serine/threonine protein kinase [Planctomycetota bacterium]|nr:serine/threonine protein kinase [Planctomycetota bacterium]